MKREYLPYYLSRAAFSTLFAGLVFGITWKAALFALIWIGLFLLYLHSGWFTIDPTTPLTPLRRDPHGKEIQRKALICAAAIALLLYLAAPYLSAWLQITLPNASALGIAVISYSLVQFALFLKDQSSSPA